MITEQGRTARLSAVDKPADQRNAFQRDRDRIIYTSAYRRLAGVSQVVSALEGHIFHNRLTHTIKVAQVARRLAEGLRKETEGNISKDSSLPPIVLDADVTESAAHAHDLGHPPFGHVAEVELQRLLQDFDPDDSFEGNAQSFRIVTKVARSNYQYQGLNLTAATLNAVLKYPWLHDSANRDNKAFTKWGAYTSELDHFRFACDLRQDDPLPIAPAPQGLEASIMDWADDITYAVHDVEDLYRAGLVPADQLASNEATRSGFGQWVMDRWRARGDTLTAGDADRALRVFDLLGTTNPYDGSSDQRTALRTFTSTMIGRYVKATSLAVSGSALGGAQWKLDVAPYARQEVNILKELTWRYVIEKPALAAQQHGQKRVVAALFSTYMDAADSSNRRVDRALLPTRVLGDLDGLQAAGMSSPATRSRVVCDAICSMTEDEALKMFARLSGQSLGSVLDSIV